LLSLLGHDQPPQRRGHHLPWLASGTAYSNFDGDAICDGTKHTIKVAAAADSSGVPFKLGTAAIAVAGDASYSVQNQEEWSQSWVAASASTGWMSVRLGK
jgi:hypothetical protein